MLFVLNTNYHSSQRNVVKVIWRMLFTSQKTKLSVVVLEERRYRVFQNNFCPPIEKCVLAISTLWKWSSLSIWILPESCSIQSSSRLVYYDSCQLIFLSWRWFSGVLFGGWQWNNVCITSSMRIGGHKVRMGPGGSSLQKYTSWYPRRVLLPIAVNHSGKKRHFYPKNILQLGKEIHKPFCENRFICIKYQIIYVWEKQKKSLESNIFSWSAQFLTFSLTNSRDEW